MSHPLRTGVPRVLGNHGGTPGRRFHAHVQAMMVRLGPFDGLRKRLALTWNSYERALGRLEELQGVKR